MEQETPGRREILDMAVARTLALAIPVGTVPGGTGSPAAFRTAVPGRRIPLAVYP